MNCELKARVPQGSVLGPTLLSTAIRELHILTLKKNYEIFSYADAIIMIAGLKNKSEVHDIKTI